MENDNKRLPGVHFAAPYLLNPVHPLKVDLVGAGGSGSQMLSALARINAALTDLGGLGLQVRVFDPDRVEEANIGRQLFSPSELGLNKAVALVSRFNRFYGTDWDAVNALYEMPCQGYEDTPNIVITCVDNLRSRSEIGRILEKASDESVRGPEHRTWYWLDLGNGQRTGQAVLGSVGIPQPECVGMRTVERLPFFTQRFDVSSIREEDSGPSCSMAEALRKQDLFINSSLVQLAGSLLWTLLHKGCISCAGFFLNLEDMVCAPIEL